MKLQVLLLFFCCNISLMLTAQSDSLQRYLDSVTATHLPNDTIPIVSPIIFPPFWPIDTLTPYPPINTEWLNNITIGAYEYYVPVCGDSYHENGKLSSRIHCKDGVFHGLTTYWNENGVKISETNYVNGMAEGKSYSWSDKGFKTRECNYVNGKEHGKSIRWDENGHKQYEYTYAYGRCFKQKTYGTYGELKSVQHYTYTKTGDQVLHGTCISYSENEKEIMRYKNGKLDGIIQQFQNGKLMLEQLYKVDYLQEQKAWNANQQLIGHNTYSETGQLEHLQEWDSTGILTKEEFRQNGGCIGTWTNYYPPTDSKTLTYYSDRNPPSHLLKKEVYEKGVLTQHYGYTNGYQTDIIFFYKNGHKKFQTHTDSNNRHTHKAWNENLILTDSICWYNNSFSGAGFYSKGDTIYVFKVIDSNNNSPMLRWALLNNDTLRQDYIINSYANRNQILHSNYYAKNGENESVRSGVWSFYDGNTISHALTYNQGEITGRAVYYSQKAGVLDIAEYGDYVKGIKHGRWIIQNDSTRNNYTYASGILNGPYLSNNLNGDTLIIGSYLDNKKNDYWEFYNPDGTLAEAGKYKNDLRIGKWLQWYTNDKGKRKKRKI